MRVLHIGAGNMYGGIETFLLDLARMRNLCPEMLPSFGFCFDGRIAKSIRETGAPLELLGEMRASRPWTIWRSRKKLHSLLLRERYEQVIFHGSWTYALLASVLKSTGIQPVLWCHGSMSAKTWDERRVISSRPHRVLASSHFTAASVARFLPAGCVKIVRYAVALPETADPVHVRQEIRRVLNTESSQVVILQVSRMEEWKGHGVLLQALARIADDPRWVCWIAGGPQRDSEQIYFNDLHTLAAKLNIAGRIQFLGQRADVAQLMAAADIFCQPNTSPEPFGIVFIEALYARKPVVTAAHGGALEIVDDSCGILIPPRDDKTLADALQKLISDPELRVRLGTHARERAKELCDPYTTLKHLFTTLQNDLI
jgi:glycosyltransferase involved in cell wall biosynthesis